jgi:hypothetical protein
MELCVPLTVNVGHFSQEKENPGAAKGSGVSIES